MERDFKGIWIPKEVWLNKELKVMEKLFLVEIDSLDGEKGCYASNAYFADFFDLSKSRCTEIIKSLEKKGLISVEIVYKEGSKEIEKRILRCIRFSEGGYSENRRGVFGKPKDNNTIYNNTINNIDNMSSCPKEDKKADLTVEVINYLNEKAGTKYKAAANKTKSLVAARVKEGYSIEDFKTVIDKKVRAWLNDPKMSVYLRPETLFGTKFEGYLNEKEVAGPKKGETKFNNFEARNKDYSKLENDLLEGHIEDEPVVEKKGIDLSKFRQAYNKS